MIGTTIAVRRIAMARLHDLSLQFFRARDRRVDVVDLEPQEDAVSRRELWISDAAVMVLHVPPVQLEDQSSVRHEPLILRAAVGALAAKQVLVPAAGRLDAPETKTRVVIT